MSCQIVTVEEEEEEEEEKEEEEGERERQIHFKIFLIIINDLLSVPLL